MPIATRLVPPTTMYGTRSRRGFTVEATSPDDGIVEAIRCTTGPWIHAVQWHPEFHFPTLGVVDDTPLLRDFLQAASAARHA